MALSFGNNLTCFFQQYIHFPRNHYDSEGNLTEAAVKEAIKMLLDNSVFDSPADMRLEAFKDYGIFLAPALFEKEK